MKKLTYLIVAGVLVYGTSCSSTDTATTADAGTTMSTNDAAGDDTAAGTGTASDTASDAGTASAGTASGGTSASGTMMMDATTIANMNDATFMMTSASSNLLEIQAGQLALSNSSNAEVKQFAQMMVDHHTKASKEQMSLASTLKVQLPTALMPMHQTMLDKLRSKTGKDFDEAYMDMMEVAHNTDIAMFEAKSSAAETATVKAFAEKTLPMLKSHKAAATKIEDTVD